MKVNEIPEILQSSALAPLFVDLENPEVEHNDEKNKTTVRLRVKSPVTDKDEDRRDGWLILVETETKIFLRIPWIIEAKDGGGTDAMRAAHVNSMVGIGRVYWDPDDGEIGVDWVLTKSENSSVSAEGIELVIASLLEVYCNESLFFLAAKLKNLPGSMGGPLAEQAGKRAEDFQSVLAPVFGS